MSVDVHPLSQTDLLRELEPVVEENLERHLTVAKEWLPHEYVPWSEGRDFDGMLGGEAWEPGDSKMSDVARTSLIVNLLTEDNLPELPPRDRHGVRPRRRVGHLGAPVDGRGGPARDRHPRLPAGDPRGRPGRAGARPDDAHGGRLRVGQPRRPAAVAGLRVLPGARHPHLAPQHRQGHRRPDRASSCWPGSRPTRTCTCSSTGTCSVPPSRSRRTRRCGPSPRW